MEILMLRDPETFVFGPFRLLVDRRELLSHEGPVRMGSRAFDLLLALVRRQGQVATKDELLAEVWPDTVVEENTLQVQISALRKVFGEEADGTRYLVTIPGRGYRFVVPVGLERAIMPPTTLSPEAETKLTLPDKPSIAVLPFTNMSGDPEQDYFADGIAEEIITALARFPSLFVIARNSSFTYKAKATDVKQIGGELGVRYVLEGSVRKAGSRVRLTGQLIQAESGVHLWADHYDRDLSDIFALQDEMAASIVGVIVPSMQQAEIERIRSKPPDSLDAYDLYLRALPAFYACTRGSNERALQFVELALELDPNYLAATILAENCWSLFAAQGWIPAEQAHLNVIKYARRAGQIDKDNAEALATLARRVCAIERNYEEAVSLAQRAVTLNPNSAVAWRESGYALIYCARAEAALEHLQRAIRLSPRDPRAEDCWAGIALALIQLNRDSEAISAGRNAVQANPNSATAWRAFSAALALDGQIEEARTGAKRLMTIDPNCTLASMMVRYGYTEAARARYFAGLQTAGIPET
jgi:TolB-like protein/tetratricopeptide (TPR) repeat protein